MQSLRASRLALAHLPRSQAMIQRRSFLAPSASLRADLVLNMYLKEIQNYKAPSLKPSDADAHVQKFTMPKPPPSPEESDIAKDLKAYEEQTVEVEGQAADGAPVVEEDWFEEDEEDEEEKAHH